MKKNIILVCTLIIWLTIWVSIYVWLKPTQIQTARQISSAAAIQTDLPPPKAAAKADRGYRLIVGANPRFNQEQTFFPPTNSVAITNGEEQLRQLVLETKPQR